MPHNERTNQLLTTMATKANQVESPINLRLKPGESRCLHHPKDESGEEEEDDNEQGATCGACGDNYGNDEFWICCDICERWFHGKCEHIKQYKCTSCSSKKARV